VSLIIVLTLPATVIKRIESESVGVGFCRRVMTVVAGHSCVTIVSRMSAPGKYQGQYKSITHPLFTANSAIFANAGAFSFCSQKNAKCPTMTS
jgi:hypothetical protein